MQKNPTHSYNYLRLLFFGLPTTETREISCETKVFSPRHATLLAHTPRLNLRDDLSLEYDGLPCGHLLSQQVAHGGGELGLRLYDLRRLLVHHHGAGA